MKIFTRDFFSNHKIKWVNCKDLELLSFLKKNFYLFRNAKNIQLKKIYNRKQINSGNFKICYNKKELLLKIEKVNTKNTLKLLKTRSDILEKLKRRGLPIILMKLIQDKKKYFIHDKKLFSFYEYSDGSHFSGTSTEIHNISKTTVKLIDVLSNITDQNPKYLFKYKKIKYFTYEEDKILKRLYRNKKNWKKLFKKNYLTVKTNWNMILNLRDEARSAIINKGNYQLCHIDLHPHNFIFRNGTPRAILDFASLCGNYSGYALAFALLKQSRQCFTVKKNKHNMEKIVTNYIDEINSIYEKKPFTRLDLYFLSISEVLRRIMIIFKLLLISKDRSWEHVLPIQIKHLKEAQKIFKI